MKVQLGDGGTETVKVRSLLNKENILHFSTALLCQADVVLLDRQTCYLAKKDPLSLTDDHRAKNFLILNYIKL